MNPVNHIQYTMLFHHSNNKNSYVLMELV